MAACLAAMGAVLAHNQEPTQPIVPPQQLNLGLAERGKTLNVAPRLSTSGFIS